MKKYAKFYFKGGLIITGERKDVEIGYNPYMKKIHPVSVKITPLESVWTGNLHFTVHFPITFALWDLLRVVLVEDYLSTETEVKTFLIVKENPKHFYRYWKRVAEKLETLSGKV